MPRRFAAVLLLGLCACGARSGLEQEPPPAAACPPEPCAISSDLDEDGFDARACGGEDCNDDHGALFPGATPPARGWTLEAIARSRGSFSGRIAVAAGAVHVLSNEGGDPGTCRNDLALYTRPAGGAWSRTPLDERVYTGGYHAIAAGPGPRAVHLAYPNGRGCDTPTGTGSGGYVSAASGTAGDLALERLEEDPDSAVGEGAALAVDATGRVWLAYQHAVSTTLRVGALAGGRWELEDVATDARWLYPVGLAASCAPRVAYVTEGGALRELRRDDGRWSAAELGTSDGPPSLVIDGLGRSHVFFAREGVVVHAVEAAAGWDEEPVAEGARPSAAIAPDDTLHVLYEEARTPRLATRRGAGWETEDIPMTRRGTRADLAVDGAGIVHLVFEGPDGPVHATRVDDDLACPPGG